MDTHRSPSRLSSTVLGGMLIAALAACGGAGGGTAAPTVGGPGSTDAAATSEASEDTGAATQGPGGGGSLDACALLTNDEVAAATGLQNVVGGGIPAANLTDAISGCAWVSGGTIPAVNVIYLQHDASDPEAVKLLPETEEISVGGGAKAFWVPGAGLVALVYKGDKIVMIQVLMPLNNDVKATASGLAQKVAGRMG
jgi:hypothetical protein